MAATNIVPGPKPAPSHPDGGITTASPFRTEAEACEFSGEEPPALIINPGASAEALLAAVKSRARRLHKHIDNAARADSGEVTAADLADPLWGLSEEILILLEAIKPVEVRHG